MRVVSVENLKGNEVVGKRIYDEAGRTLLTEGTKLTLFYVERLKGMGITSLYIDDEISQDVVIEDNVSEKTRQMSKMAVKDMMERYSRDGKINNDGVIKSANSIIDDILSNKDVLINVSDIRAKGDRLYSHSVNVCVLSTVIGIHLGYNMLKLKDLSIGAILHDLGKTKALVDKKILEKKLSDEEMNKYLEKAHPRIGYDFLGSQNSFSATTKVAVLMHHERVDGSGYPLGLKGPEINDVAKLVCICDQFDNMVTGDEKTPPKPVYEVLEYLVGMSGYHFDVAIVKKFTENIAAYPSGSGIKLNTNEKCLVLRQNKSLPARPVIKVIYGKGGEKVSEPYEIDLSKELTLFITGTCVI